MNELTLKKSRRSAEGGGKFERRPFLKSEHLSPKGNIAVVDEFREAGPKMRFCDYLLDIRIGAKKFTMTLKQESWQLDSLIDYLGPKPKRWAGKKFPLYRGQWQKSKHESIAVVRIGKPEKAS